MNFNTKIVKTYAKSLFQSSANLNSLKEKESSFKISKLISNDKVIYPPDIYILGEELLLLRAVILSDEKIEKMFKNPTYSEKQKEIILLTVFPGLTVTMKSFLKVLAERMHLSLIPEISNEYNSILLKFKNLITVKLIVATPLEDSYGPLLLKTLKNLTGSNEIKVNIAFNPKLLGGFILEYNSVAIDTSILNEFSLFFTDL